jgi:hypothetical protein
MKVPTLLTVANPKTLKSLKEGYYTAIQHFAPSKLSGYNSCEYATGECIRFCLNKAGRAGIFTHGSTTNRIQEARKARTRFFFENPFAYRGQLMKECLLHVRRSERLGLRPAFRLNGTSDIPWEQQYPGLFWRLSDWQFYDYTKDLGRYHRFLSGWEIPNYHLTFSRSEENHDECLDILRKGGTVAAVFDSVPDHFCGFPVLSGDNSDLRFLDSPGHWIGLKAKGKLARQSSPFKVTTEQLGRLLGRRAASVVWA